jgi:hypothetical protein
MRVNIYNEELTREVSVVSTSPIVKGHEQTFHGVRVYLKSPEELHFTPHDDDRSAVTFWFGDRETCLRLAQAMSNVIGTEDGREPKPPRN